MKFTNQLRGLWHRLKPNAELKPLSPDDFANRVAGSWRAVFAAQRHEVEEPMHFGDRAPEFSVHLSSTIPECGVLDTAGVSIVGKHGWIFCSPTCYSSRHTWFGEFENEMRAMRVSRGANRKLAGTCLSLASDFASKNYGHFILDVIPRIHLFQTAGYAFEDVDHIFLPRPPSKSAQYLLEAAGVPIEKCIWAESNENGSLVPERTVAPSFPGQRRHYPVWVPDFLKRLVGTVGTHSFRKLYISRRGHDRSVENGSEIESLLIERGFDIVDASSPLNLIEAFAEASIVVGPHGAGLSDIAFCCPGTDVIELVPPQHAFPYYFTLSKAAGLNYSAVLGSSLGKDANAKDWGGDRRDFHVDIVDLKDALDFHDA